ncbi:hypothetical protein PC116_g14729 [Phytophthora cactorum]|nr:hypothetical protein PC114_g11895 [Phytophthora cactorum]KAG4237212.1 hypothetical protein PC116_g14729 [Phytophthora cactorum]
MRNAFGQLVVVRACIIDGCTDEFLIGVDFMSRHRANLDFERNEVRYFDKETMMVIPFRTAKVAAVRMTRRAMLASSTVTSIEVAAVGPDGEEGIFTTRTAVTMETEGKTEDDDPAEFAADRLAQDERDDRTAGTTEAVLRPTAGAPAAATAPLPVTIRSEGNVATTSSAQWPTTRPFTRIIKKRLEMAALAATQEALQDTPTRTTAVVAPETTDETTSAPAATRAPRATARDVEQGRSAAKDEQQRERTSTTKSGHATSDRHGEDSRERQQVRHGRGEERQVTWATPLEITAPGRTTSQRSRTPQDGAREARTVADDVNTSTVREVVNDDGEGQAPALEATLQLSDSEIKAAQGRSKLVKKLLKDGEFQGMKVAKMHGLVIIETNNGRRVLLPPELWPMVFK